MCVSVRVRASKLFTYRVIVLMHYLATLLPIQSHQLAFQSTSKQLTTAITPLDVHPFPNTTKQIHQKSMAVFPMYSQSQMVQNIEKFLISLTVFSLTSSESSVFIGIFQNKVPTFFNSSSLTNITVQVCLLPENHLYYKILHSLTHFFAFQLCHKHVCVSVCVGAFGVLSKRENKPSQYMQKHSV